MRKTLCLAFLTIISISMRVFGIDYDKICFSPSLLEGENRYLEELKMLEEPIDHPNSQSILAHLGSVLIATPKEIASSNDCTKLKSYVFALRDYYKKNKEKINPEVLSTVEFIIKKYETLKP